MTLAIPGAVTAVVVLSESDSVISGKGFTFRPVIGGFILGAFLLIISELNEHLAVLFAVLIVLNAVIQHGSPLLKLIGGTT